MCCEIWLKTISLVLVRPLTAEGRCVSVMQAKHAIHCGKDHMSFCFTYKNEYFRKQLPTLWAAASVDEFKCPKQTQNSPFTH